MGRGPECRDLQTVVKLDFILRAMEVITADLSLCEDYSGRSKEEGLQGVLAEAEPR